MISATLIFASVNAITATMFVNPAYTNTTATLSVMVNLNQAAQGLIITQQSAFMPATCLTIDPVLIPVISCVATGNQLNVKFSQNVAGSFYFQASPYLTPATTTYTGFTVTPYDTNSITLEQMNNIQLSSLAPRPLVATILSGSTRLGAMTTLAVSVTPKSQCATCVLDIAGPGLSQATCTGCSQTPQGFRIQQTLLYNKMINFQLSNIQNPNSFSGNVYTVQVTDTSSGGICELATTTVTATDPAILTNPSAILTGSTAIGMLTSVQLDFTIPASFTQACSINVTIPSDFTNLQQFTQQVQASGVLQNTQQFQILPNNLVSIMGACVMTQGQARLTISFMRNPVIVRPTQSFKVTIADSQGRVVGVTTDAISIQGFTPGGISTLSVSLSSTTVQTKSAATFSILPQHQLYQQSYLIITLPSQFNITSTSIQCSSLNLITSLSVPMCQLNSNTITITSLFYSTGYNPQTDGPIIVQVSSFFTTPDSVVPLTFQVQTFADANQPVDSSSFTLSPLTPGSLTPTYQIVNDTASFTTQMFLSFTLASKVGLGSIIQVTLPPDIGLSLTPYCTGLPSLNCTLKVVQQNVVQISGLGSKTSGTKVNFTIGDLKLPRYTGPITTPVTIATLTSSLQAVDNGTVSLNVTKPVSLNSLKVVSSSLSNSASTSLQISFETSLITQANDNVLIVFNRKVYLMPYQANFTIVTNNPASSQPQTLIVSVLDQYNRTLANSQAFMYQTTLPSVLQVNLWQSSIIASAPSNYTFISQTILGCTVITLPTCMQLPSRTIDQAFTIISTNQIQLVVQTLNFTLALVNPSESCLSQQIKIMTYSDNTTQYFVGTQLLQPSIACNGLCTACQPANRSFCTQCPKLLSLFQGQCVNLCPTSFFSLNQQCTSCEANCASCNSQKCLSCNNGTVLLNGTCVQPSDCKQPNFIQNNTCSTCQLPCMQCSSQGQCLKCQPQTYLLNGQCSDTCQLDYELTLNVCEQQTVGKIAFGLFLQLPCTYSYAALCVILLLVKLCLRERMSLVMTHVMLLQVMVQGSLIYAAIQNTILYIQNPVTDLTCALAFLPMTVVLLQMVLNLWISIVHYKVLQGYSSHRAIYLPSVILTYHCLSQVGLGRKEQDPTEKQINSMRRYLVQYSGATKAYFYLSFSAIGILIYQSYLDGQARLRSLDTCVLLLVLAIWLQLALYYPPEDHIVSVYITDSLTDLNDNEAMANNSIHLQINKLVRKMHTPAKTPAPTRDNVSLCEIQLQDVSQTVQPKRLVLDFEPDVSFAESFAEVQKMDQTADQQDNDLTVDQMMEYRRSERPKKKLTFLSEIQ